MWRAVLILLVINGLVPAMGEGVEALVHLVETGHVAHDAAHHAPSGDDEHGCGPTAHHCACCHSQSVLAETFVEAPTAEVREHRVLWLDTRIPSAPSLNTPFRPPIG